MSNDRGFFKIRHYQFSAYILGYFSGGNGKSIKFTGLTDRIVQFIKELREGAELQIKTNLEKMRQDVQKAIYSGIYYLKSKWLLHISVFRKIMPPTGEIP